MRGRQLPENRRLAVRPRATDSGFAAWTYSSSVMVVRILHASPKRKPATKVVGSTALAGSLREWKYLSAAARGMGGSPVTRSLHQNPASHSCYLLHRLLAAGSFSPTRLLTEKVSFPAFLSASTITWSPCST